GHAVQPGPFGRRTLIVYGTPTRIRMRRSTLRLLWSVDLGIILHPNASFVASYRYDDGFFVVRSNGRASRITDYLGGPRDRIVRHDLGRKRSSVFLTRLKCVGRDMERSADMGLHWRALFDHSIR